MLGTIIGDIIGSKYEHKNIKTKKFNLFSSDSVFTDDTVMTCAIAKAVMNFNIENDKEIFKKDLIENMQFLGRKYINAGYGGSFIKWILSSNPLPYNSFGNGSAMRVSPVAWYAKTLKETEELASITASVSHNHKEGIKGAKATASAVYLALNNFDKENIKKYIENNYYNLNFNLEDVKKTINLMFLVKGQYHML